MEDAENAHRSRPRVLDAVDLAGRQVKAGARSERYFVAIDVRDALARDDVADLVVGMAVERRLARLDDAEELRYVAAAGVLVDQVAVLPFLRSFELRLVLEAHGDFARLAALAIAQNRDELE